MKKFSIDIVATEIATGRRPKIKFVKTEFGVATIVYSGKLQKNKKDKTMSAKNPNFGFGSRLRVGKVLAPYNVRPKTVPLIKCAKGCGFQNIYFFTKIVIKEYTKETKIIFSFLGPTRINPRSYVSSFIMENHGYVVL